MRVGPGGIGGREGNARVDDGGRLLLRRVGVSAPSSRMGARQLRQLMVTNFPATRFLYRSSPTLKRAPQALQVTA
jgi:hypothetical protein